jgi:hypothetical protein
LGCKCSDAADLNHLSVLTQTKIVPNFARHAFFALAQPDSCLAARIPYRIFRKWWRSAPKRHVDPCSGSRSTFALPVWEEYSHLNPPRAGKYA